MATIAIDARFYGTENTGLGRYTANVLAHLPGHLPRHTLRILLRKKYFDSLTFPSNVEKILADYPPYSIAEQLTLPSLLASLSSSLLYTFHFNVPLFTDLPTVVTIHDLIKTYSTGRDTTTRAPWLYALKRHGYEIVMHKAATGSCAVIVPTNTVKNDLLARYPQIPPERIHPIPEAPDEIFRANLGFENLRLELPHKYLLFVGNAYPHKNLPVLLDALSALPEYSLVMVAKSTPYLEKCLSALSASARARIHLFSGLDDRELVSIHLRAAMLVTPSLMEGYGLVGLEALMVGTPVIASNIPVYREVYGDRVTYFDPQSSKDLISAIKSVGAHHRMRPTVSKRTWGHVAHDIAGVINEACVRL